MQRNRVNRSFETGDPGMGTATLSTSGMRERCKRIVMSGLYHTGLLQIAERIARTHELRATDFHLPRFHRFSGSKFGILCYHRIGTEGVPLFSRLNPRIFEAQMKYIKRHYRVVSLAQLCLELEEQRSVAPTLAVTFDDGYRDLYTYAFPILRKYQIPATIYLIGHCMETGEAPWYDRIFAAVQASPERFCELRLDVPRRFEFSSCHARLEAAWKIVSYLRTISDRRRHEWCKTFESVLPVPEAYLRERMLNWQQVRTLHQAGLSFGAHTQTHPSVRRLEPDDLTEELVRSRRILENGLQSSVLDFAYPFGKMADCSVAAERFLVTNGYRSAATTIGGCNTGGTNIYRLRRLQIGDSSIPAFAFDLSGMFLDCESSIGPQGFHACDALLEQ
jgi:peptidoglycan/xylan/chitin deacetylase (PgdA/CDA1 family)